MLGVRDLMWAAGVCALLTWLVQCRPSWNAQRFVERESRAGFETAFAGYRFITGDIVSDGGGGTHIDPMAPPITFYRLLVEAERLSWNGKRAEFVVRHKIELQGRDASQDIHVRLERRGASWVYTLFQVRGRPPLADPNQGNPWARALRPDPES